MNPEKYQQAKAIFTKAIEVPDPKRAAFLQNACGDDSELRELVDSLLEADKIAGQFLEKPPLDLLEAPATEASLAGKRIGPYRIVKGIGHGGMGDVYLAIRDDDQYKKQVALKLIRRGMGSEEILRRFKTERQILASLTHPNIARLLDGGVTEDGLPYFVMEYIEGQPIDAYCDARRLTTKERLALFGKVCSAVQYAHRNLVVHRDLKPSNILVGADGEPKLLDFGIAKLLNPDLSPVSVPLTATLMQILTPEYASPEQVRGEPVTTASDVYSLGVLLYELLTGRRPYHFQSRLPREIERIICESEPQKPSTVITRAEEITTADGRSASLTPADISEKRDGRPDTLRKRLAGDIDNIVLMALRKEPNRRYSSVEQFAEDLRRHLEGLPVIARRDTAGYRISKFIQRHRVGVIAAALVALALLAGLAGTAWQANLAAAERDKARLEAAKAEQVSQFLIDLFEVSDPGESQGDTITAREILERGAEKLEGELKNQPEVRATMANVIGKVYQSLGLYDQAAQFIEMGLEIRKGLYAGDNEFLAESYNNWASVLAAQGQYEQAEQVAQKALEMKKRLWEDNNVKLTEDLDNLATIFYYQGKYRESEFLFRKSLKIREVNIDSTHPDLISNINNLAVVLKLQGNTVESEPLYRRALELGEARLGNNHFELATYLDNYALYLHEQGNFAEAEPLYRRALTIRLSQLGPNHPSTATGLNNLALLLHDQGKFTEAEPLYRQALEIEENRLGGIHPDVATSLNNLATLMEDQGNYSVAESLFNRALEIRETQLGPNHPDLANSLNTLAVFWGKQGKHEKAEILARRSLRIRETQLGPNHLDVTNSLNTLAHLLCLRSEYDEAEPYYRRSLEIREAQLEENHPAIATSIAGLADALKNQGKYSDAERLIKRALEIFETNFGKDHPKTEETRQSYQELLEIMNAAAKE